MEPVAEIQRVRAGVVTWQGYDPSVRCDLTSTAIEMDGEWLLVDPIPLTPDAMRHLTDHYQPAAILLTNGNHQRHSLELREAFGIPILAPSSAREELIADDWFGGSESVGRFPLRAIPLPGAGLGETAFWCDRRATLVVGDALIHLPPEGFRMLPEKYCSDSAQLKQSLMVLGDLPAEVLCFAHGRPVVDDAVAYLNAIPE